ncbi:MAG: RNA polymerase sigma factor [Rhodothermales bacterium]|nr:RNA polymerase sigma factor [Rhodothermales bacterium]
MDDLIPVIKRARDGDPAAVNQVLGRLHPILESFFISRIGRRPEVADLTQNSLLRVHRGIQDLKKPGSLKSFAMKGAVYELQDYYRGRYSVKELLFDSADPPLHATDPKYAGDRVDVEKALQMLSPKARKIIELREYGYKYSEIADMVDTTEAAVKMQVKRAFDRMRDLLAVILILMLLS